MLIKRLTFFKVGSFAPNLRMREDTEFCFRADNIGIKSEIEEGIIKETRPEDWGGYQISVDYFEFWEANNDRLNYRESYKLENNEWRRFFLQS